MHATRSLDRYVSLVKVIDNNQIIFTKGKGRRMGSENDKKETPTSKSTRVYMCIYVPECIVYMFRAMTL